MHPGSQVTIAGNAFQQSFIMAGNQNLQLQGTEPSVNDGNQMTEDAQMFKDFLHEAGDNDSSPNRYAYDQRMPAYGPNSFPNKSKDARGLMPPPLLPRGVARNTAGNDFLVFTEHGGAQPVTPSHASSSELMNSNDDQSVSGASAMQESSEDAHGSLSSVSTRKKRGRSASDDGSSSGSMWTGADGFHRFPKHRRAKKPKSDAAVKKEAPEAASMSRKQSLAAADYSNLKLGSTPLTGMSSKDAAEIYVRRVDLEVVGDDNFEEVKADRGKWLRAIAARAKQLSSRMSMSLAAISWTRLLMMPPPPLRNPRQPWTKMLKPTRTVTKTQRSLHLTESRLMEMFIVRHMR
jgi:hypothetical protein